MLLKHKRCCFPPIQPNVKLSTWDWKRLRGSANVIYKGLWFGAFRANTKTKWICSFNSWGEERVTVI